MVRVKLFANFRELAGVQEVEVEARSIRDVLFKLVDMYPKLKDVFFEGEKVRDYVHIMVNGRHVRENLDTELKDSDVVAIFPPVSGG